MLGRSHQSQPYRLCPCRYCRPPQGNKAYKRMFKRRARKIEKRIWSKEE